MDRDAGGAFSANKLSFAFLRENGRPVGEALRWYDSMLALGCIPLGFNMQHDGRQMRGELRRAGMPDLFDETPNVCAMRSMQAAKIKVKKLNGKGGFPRLIDVAAHFGVPATRTSTTRRPRTSARRCTSPANCTSWTSCCRPPCTAPSILNAGEQS
jgi:hypothetical protein